MHRAEENVPYEPTDDELRTSVMEETFPQYHSRDGVLLPRSSGVLKLHPHSLHRVLHFGNPDEEFVENVRRTCIEGNRVHDAIHNKLKDLMLRGRIACESFSPEDMATKPTDDLNESEKEKTNRCVEWIERLRPTVMRLPEQTIFSPSLGFAGTPDLVCRTRHEILIVDFKTGKKLQEGNLLQAESYRMLLERETGIVARKIAILLLGIECEEKALCKTRIASEERGDDFSRLLDRWNGLFPEPFEPAANCSSNERFAMKCERSAV